MHAPVAVLFANLKGNVGDFAILHAILIDLSKWFPDAPLHVYTHPFHAIDSKRLSAFKASGAPEFEHIGTSYFREIAPIMKLVPRLFWPMVQGRLVRSLAESIAAKAEEFQNYRAIFVAGGDHWSGKRLGISMFGSLIALRDINDRIYAFPFSVNPSIFRFNSARALKNYFSTIRQPIVVRDGISKTVMDKVGIHAVCGADCVYSLREIAESIQPASSGENSRVLFAVTGRRKRFEEDLRNALREALSASANVALLTTCEREDGKVFLALSREYGIPYLAPRTWQEVVAELRASALVVTNRLHCLILSCLAESPALPISDRKKSEAFVIDARMPYHARTLKRFSKRLLQQSMADRRSTLERMLAYRESACASIHRPVVE
jgi:polysaccharide pyruvyl transferase WcaK-like protein